MRVRPDYQDIFVKSLNGHELQGCETLVQSIERTTMRTLTMETSLADNLDKCHPQDRSPLYAKLPKEIRDLIFEFATAQYEDLEHEYNTNTFYYRPGHRAPLKTSTALLRTCRRVWLETSALPMQQSKKTFWLEGSRGPNGQLSYDFAIDWTSLNRKNYTTLHLFTQKHMADRLFKSADSISAIMYDLKPRVFHVTWRHTDWNRWEDPLPLELDERWIHRALSSSLMQGVQRFELELETLARNEAQLEAIVDRISKLEGLPIQLASDNNNLATQRKVVDEPAVWHWTGRPDINDHVDEAHGGMEKLDYHVMILTWKAVPALEPERPSQPSTEFDYWTHLHSRGLMRTPRPPRTTTHTVRLHMLQGGWQRRQFPFANYLVRKEEMDMAERTERMRRMQFCRAFADIEARKFEERWKMENSLLKFEDD